MILCLPYIERARAYSRVVEGIKLFNKNKSINKNLQTFYFYFPKGAGCSRNRRARGWSAVGQRRVCSVWRPSRLARQGVCRGDSLLTGWGNVSKKCRHTVKTERDFCVLNSIHAHTRIYISIPTSSAFVRKCCESVKMAYYIYIYISL